jgi:hypothetical protein
VSNIDQPEMSHTAIWCAVLIYCFSIHSADGNDRETSGRMALADDNAARAFGKAMIRDMMRGDPPRYAGWTMDVAKGTRPVCSIPFPPERIPSAALA